MRLTATQQRAVLTRLGYDEATIAAHLKREADQRRALRSMSADERNAYLADQAEQQRKRAEKFRADRKEREKAEAKAARLKRDGIDGTFTRIDEKDASK